jgi:hypothetical protein
MTRHGPVTRVRTPVKKSDHRASLTYLGLLPDSSRGRAREDLVVSASWKELPLSPRIALSRYRPTRRHRLGAVCIADCVGSARRAASTTAPRYSSPRLSCRVSPRRISLRCLTTTHDQFRLVPNVAAEVAPCPLVFGMTMTCSKPVQTWFHSSDIHGSGSTPLSLWKVWSPMGSTLVCVGITACMHGWGWR